MLNSARRVLEYVAEADEAKFLKDQMMQDAVVRQLEILGEAAGRVSAAFQESHSEIDWVGPISMRNVLIHQYRRINLESVWNTVERDLPKLTSQLELLVGEEER